MTLLTLLLACSSEPAAPPATTPPAPTTPAPTTPTPTATTGGAPTGETGVELEVVGEAPMQFLGARPRNVLMISVDTFRRDHVGAFGSLGLTPRIDQLVAEGVSLDEHMQCSSWTYPGTTCTLLGRSHIDNGFLPQLSGGGREPFADGTEFLATWLAAAGYDTSISSRNGWLSEEWNNVQGYGTILPGGGSAEAQLDLALDHVSLLPEGTPWFAHVHATEPHVPYNPPDEYLGALDGLEPILWNLAENSSHYAARDLWDEMDEATQELVLLHMKLRYEAEIRWLDDQIAEGLANFEVQGLLDDTLVVLWNDHGEQFWEHGNLTHAYNLHPEENDGFAVWWADNILPVRWAEPTHAVDVAPTVLSALGLEVPPIVAGYPAGQRPDGPRFALVIARLGAVSSVVDGGQKLIFDWDEGRRHRYDTVTDPDELVDLWGTDPAIDEALWATLRPQVEAAHAIEPELDLVWPDATQ